MTFDNFIDVIDWVDKKDIDISNMSRSELKREWETFSDKFQPNSLNECTRVEVIDSEGRHYVNNNVNIISNSDNVRISHQDEDRTLKIFLR